MKIKTYKSGLRIVVHENKDNDIISFRIFVNCGSKDENVDEFGIAHFLEHLYFKSNNKNNYFEILQKFDNMGTQYNAYTSKTHTCYYFKCLKNVFEKNLELFSNMFFNLNFKKEEVAQEKKVIMEELKTTFDNPEKLCINNAFKYLFGKNPYSHEVIGTKSTIKSINSEKLKNFKTTNYKPNNIVISVSGNTNIKNIEKLLVKYFSPLLNGENNNFSNVEYYPIESKNKYVAQFKDNEQATVNIFLDLGEKTQEQMYPYDLFFAILGYGMSSKFFDKIRNKKGLVYSIFSETFRVGKNNLADISFASSNDNAKKVLKEIINILNECSTGNISEEELLRAKNKILANLQYSLENNSSISYNNGEELLSDNKIEKTSDIVKNIKAITLLDVIKVGKEILYFKNYVVSSVGKISKSDLKSFKLKDKQ